MNHSKTPSFFWLFVLLAWSTLLPINLQAATVTSFDDITYWVGEGSNKAALAIDWFGDDANDNALVWGYRWDGTATGEQMLREVLTDDRRFFAKLSSPGPLGIAAYGFGYDENNDQQFELDDETAFNADGIAITSPSDGAETNEEDRYREGWSTGYWHYGIASSDAEGALNNWNSSGIGPTLRPLSNGSWDSYAFAVTLNGDEFATNLIAAEQAITSIAGDFNQDGLVDAIDYATWRNGLGTTYTLLDYDAWAANYGSSNNTFALSVTIPEPTTAMLLTSLLVTFSLRRDSR